MALNLSIIKSPAGVALAVGEKTFSEQGGTIGRGDGNDWVLADPDRFLSSKHCMLTFDGGQYYLTDTSTNGTFVNGSPEPLGKGGRVPINSGDVVEMGDYQFRVDLQGASAALGDGPFLEEPDADPFASSPFDAEPATPPPVPPPAQDPFASDPFASQSDFSLNPDPVQMDPLAALDSAGKVSPSADQIPSAFDLGQPEQSGFAQPPPREDDYFASGGSHSDGAGALNQAVDWPDAQNENIIPDDWDDDLLGGGAPPASPSQAPVPPRPQTPRPQTDSSPQLRPEHVSLPLTDPPKAAKPPPQVAEPLLSERQPERVDVFPSAKPSQRARQSDAAAAKRPPPQPASKPQERSDASAETALLSGLNLSDRNLSSEEVANIHQVVGELMPVVVAGMMQVLRARASIKNEFRMNVTTIQPIENNPLKFSADAAEAIENMFTRKSAGYMGPVQAFQEGFDGIGEHQVAIIAGIRAAFKSMMDRFNPALLEKQFEKQGKGGVIPGMQKTKYWNSYTEYYQGFVDNMENTFQYLFGEEFVHAYEEQLRRLSVERKQKQKID